MSRICDMHICVYRYHCYSSNHVNNADIHCSPPAQVRPCLAKGWTGLLYTNDFELLCNSKLLRSEGFYVCREKLDKSLVLFYIFFVFIIFVP